MGRPIHYSTEIVTRCQSLITDLYPHIQGDRRDDKRFGGPLTTTFLLAMATPMILLPVERLFQRELNRAGVADDRQIDKALTKSVQEMLTKKFGQTPFGNGIDWRLVADVKSFNIADWTDTKPLQKLSEPAAKTAAFDAPATDVLLILRNALAHGGIAYLDKDGRQTDRVASMFAFVSATSMKVRALNILRVSEDGLSLFLKAWADWLAQSGVTKSLGDTEPLVAA